MYQPAETDVPSVGSFVFSGVAPKPDKLRAAINALYLADETRCVEALLAEVKLDAAARQRIHAQATQLVEAVRANRGDK
ncbi:MAG TPA: hypothetical protein VFM15_07315, partial [Gammaproteobacteria bacterium]|nr:hypothetical protein [Gammaproteobacteria bacterium]